MFGALADQWLNANPGKRESTLARDEVALRLHILPTFGKRRLDSITPVEIQNLVNGWCKTQNPATVRRSYDVVRAVCNYAVTIDLLLRTPCRGVRLPEVIARKRPTVTPTHIEQIASAMPQQYALMPWLGAVLGFRWGEVAGLRVGSFDLSQGVVTVTEQVIRGKGGKATFGPPKSKAGLRTFQAPSQVIDLVIEHLGFQDISVDEDDALLFVNDAGGPLDYSNFRRRIWIPAVAKAGVADAGFHDLRRTNVTALVLENVVMKTTKDHLGHSDPRLTLAVYAQATSEGDQVAADRLGNRFFGKAAQESRQNGDFAAS